MKYETVVYCLQFFMGGGFIKSKQYNTVKAEGFFLVFFSCFAYGIINNPLW